MPSSGVEVGGAGGQLDHTRPGLGAGESAQLGARRGHPGRRVRPAAGGRGHDIVIDPTWTCSPPPTTSSTWARAAATTAGISSRRGRRKTSRVPAQCARPAERSLALAGDGAPAVRCSPRGRNRSHRRTTLASVTATSTLSARWMPVNSMLCVAAIELRTVIPTAAATCWVIAVRPVPGPLHVRQPRGPLTPRMPRSSGARHQYGCPAASGPQISFRRRIGGAGRHNRAIGAPTAATRSLASRAPNRRSDFIDRREHRRCRHPT
jgi:hypothetical protein